MTVVGFDIGGTKIETQIFDDRWAEVARQRCETPTTYPALVATIADQIRWAEGQVGSLKSVGVGTAGLINPATGLALTANLPATGHPFPTDIAKAISRPITFVNDCRALALSEAVFGAGQGHKTVMGLIIGTGIGGGIVVDGDLHPGPTAIGGEFGHMAAPAHIISAHNLPIVQCGCGRMGCFETFLAGPGLERLALHFTGQTLSAPEISARRATDMAQVWSVWCAIAAELLHTLTAVSDPDVIVLGGGVSAVPGILDDLSTAAAQAQIPGFGPAKLALAEGGDASGARGAAYAAWKALQHD
ncbi:MAG: ROK family protein [Pseudomonadota bacterium]